MKTLANVLLGSWLVLTGLLRLGGISFPQSGVILSVLGIVTGVFFFFADRSEKLSTQMGSILLGVWLIIGGLLSLFHLHFAGSGVILAVLSVATGVMVLILRR
jgi:hypothetical protein